MYKKTSKNKRAGEIVGFRSTSGICLSFPCEFGYHCPVCEYEVENHGEYDERLHWSEYNGFVWCDVCTVDYPTCICEKDPKKATEIYLSCIKSANEQMQ